MIFNSTHKNLIVSTLSLGLCSSIQHFFLNLLQVIMLTQTSLLSSVEAGLCYVSDDGKDVLCDRMPSGETWQVCLKCNRYPLDWCRKAEPVEEDRSHADDSYCSSFGQTSTASIMTENTTPQPKMVYRRKKLRRDSNFKLEPTNMQASANYPSAISSAAHLSSAEEQPAGFRVNHEIEVVKNPTTPSVLFDGVAKDSTHKNLGISSVNDSCSSSKPDMETEMDGNGECSSSSVIVMDSTREEVTEKDFCINTLRTHGLLREYSPEDNVASGEDAAITGNSCCSRSCKICDRLDSSLNMLLCDHCEDAYHPSCYNPRSKKLPIDEWFCHSCLKKRQKNLKEPSIHNELGKCRATSVKGEANPILLMLRDTAPHTTAVRVGKGFQAEVLDWSGPIKSEEDALPEPFEINPSDFNRLLEENTQSPTKLSAIGNWIQCQAVIDRANGTICGKWRRAPFFEVQTDVWECFCAIHWDPSHADCAAPQELETEQVLKQLKYVEVLRPRVAAKRKKSDCTYKNDASLLPKLQGYLYTISTSVPYSNNEIFKFSPKDKDNIFVRTTNDAKCCKTMNIATKVKKGNYFTYVISNDKDCTTQLTENASLKLIATNADPNGTYCVLLWTCRSSREGVHAFCSKNKVSDNMKKWISGQYKKLKPLKEHQVTQNKDYKDGNCFKKH